MAVLNQNLKWRSSSAIICVLQYFEFQKKMLSWAKKKELKQRNKWLCFISVYSSSLLWMLGNIYIHIDIRSIDLYPSPLLTFYTSASVEASPPFFIEKELRNKKLKYLDFGFLLCRKVFFVLLLYPLKVIYMYTLIYHASLIIYHRDNLIIDFCIQVYIHIQS